MIEILKEFNKYKIGDLVKVINEFNVQIIEADPKPNSHFKGKRDYCFRVDILIHNGYAKFVV